MAEKSKLEDLQKSVTEEEGKIAEKLVQYIVFSLGNEEYGIGIKDVKEILKTSQITMVPNMPDFIKGIINLRGKIVVVIDLAKRFLLEREVPFASKHIIIAIAKENLFGLLVDEVIEVLSLPEEKIKSAPKLIAEKIESKYLTGVGTIDDRLVVLLDAEKVLSEEELVKLSNITEGRYQKIKSTEKKKTEVKSDQKKSKENTERKEKPD